MKHPMRLLSARQFLERCSPEWQPIGDGKERQIRMLLAEDEVLIELDGQGHVRLTDAGIMAAMTQGVGYTDLMDKS